MLIDNLRGNYRFLSGIAPYSCGVTAMPGHEIVRVAFRRPEPYRAGFERIARYLEATGRPWQALCGIELRLPAPLSFEGFIVFNAEYRKLLAAWDLLIGDANPVARTNIAPAVAPPAEPALYAFSCTVPANDAPPSFVVAGAGDLYDQADLTGRAVVRPGKTSAHALREKAGVVIDTMHERLTGLEMDWPAVTAIDVYTIYPVHPVLFDTLFARIGDTAMHGIHWHFGHPPIDALIFEMDVRGVRREEWI
ncbi:MAG: RidA family protein [candidate division Zixibacteria bacterium]|nr:RidA family protein [candidate division Zixibacteria bacterium]